MCRTLYRVVSNPGSNECARTSPAEAGRSSIRRVDVDLADGARDACRQCFEQRAPVVTRLWVHPPPLSPRRAVIHATFRRPPIAIIAIIIIIFLNLGRSSRGGGQILIQEIIVLLLLFLTLALSSWGMEKLCYAIQKSTKIKLE